MRSIPSVVSIFIFSCLVPRGGRWGMTTLCTACYTVSNIRTVTGQRKLTCCLTLWAWARSAAFRNFPCLLTSLGILAVCDKECHRPLSPCPQLLCLSTILAETVWYTHHKLNKMLCLHCLSYGLISHHQLTYSLCLCGGPGGSTGCHLSHLFTLSDFIDTCYMNNVAPSKLRYFLFEDFLIANYFQYKH